MSKTQGNVVDPVALSSDLGVDAFRYFVLREVPLGNDGEFSHEGMVARFNSDLANNFGNLAARVATVVGKKCDGIGPAPSPDSTLAAVAQQGLACSTLSTLMPITAGPAGLEAALAALKGAAEAAVRQAIPTVFAEPPVDDVFEVRLQFRLLCEELAPVVARLERVAVEVIADVDSGAGVRVLEPRASDAGVLLDDRERHSGFAESDSGEHSRLARADDDDWELRALGWVCLQAHPSRIAAVEFEFLEHHRDVLVGNGLAHEPRHHLVHDLRRWWCRQHTATVSERSDHVEGHGPRRRLVVLAHVPLYLVEEEALGSDRSTDVRRIAGDVHQREHQGRDAHVLQRRSDRGIVVVEWRSCVRILGNHGVPRFGPDGSVSPEGMTRAATKGATTIC